MSDYKARAAALKTKESLTVLAIETSCDETAAAVVRNGRQVLSNAVHTQIPLHMRYGGVVPEIASRNHVEMIVPVTEKALADAGLSYAGIDAVAATDGPGLVGALLVGLCHAKALAYALSLPFLGVNHIASHIAANYLTYPDLEPPFLCLVASGGHSDLVAVEAHGVYRTVGRTRDDAAGEAFDKVARALGLPYPGGPALEALATEGDPLRYRFYSAFNEGEGYDVSFSGIKTAVVNLMHNETQRGGEVCRADIAASFQHTVTEILSEKAVRAAAELGFSTLALAGGVSANRALRGALADKAAARDIRFCCPDFAYCTDNAAMVGAAAYPLLRMGQTSPLSLNATPNQKL